MTPGDGVWGRGGSCIVMATQLAMDDSSEESITFFKGENKKKNSVK